MIPVTTAFKVFSVRNFLKACALGPKTEQFDFPRQKRVAILTNHSSHAVGQATNERTREIYNYGFNIQLKFREQK